MGLKDFKQFNENSENNLINWPSIVSKEDVKKFEDAISDAISLDDLDDILDDLDRVLEDVEELYPDIYDDVEDDIKDLVM
tara:strand:- start:116766 stop:117005 length:240 start_codon:yes stop_codon:yes gene_type:complete